MLAGGFLLKDQGLGGTFRNAGPAAHAFFLFRPGIKVGMNGFGRLAQWVKNHRAGGTTVAGICTGVFILAQMGILNGKSATTNWQYAGMFKGKYPRVRLAPQHLVTEDDNSICTGAAAAVYTLAMQLIGRFGGK